MNLKDVSTLEELQSFVSDVESSVLKMEHQTLRSALQRLVDDNTRRGLMGGHLSWARRVLSTIPERANQE